MSTKPQHRFPHILKIPRGATITHVGDFKPEKDEPFRLIPCPEDGKAVKHPNHWGKTTRTDR